MHAIQTAQKSRFAATARADDGRDVVARDIDRDIVGSPAFAPYQMERFLTSNAGRNRGAAPPVAHCVIAPVGVCIGVAIVGIIDLILFIIARALSDCESRMRTSTLIKKSSINKDQRAGPSLAVPVFVRRNGVGKNLQWQRRDRLGQVVVPKTIAKRGEKQRRGFARDAGEREQNAGNDSFRRGFHHDVHNRFPARDPERERGFAIAVRHKQNTSSVVRMISGIIIRPRASPPA